MTDDRIIDPQGQPVAAAQDSEPTRTPLTDLVEQPAKVMRIGGMIRQLLDEVKSAPLDEASRSRLREIHHQSIDELKDGLAPELVDELERLSLPFGAEAPSDAELRVAQAQLVGWLEGLFHGIQAALYAQQVQAQSQLQNMRLALPGGPQGDGTDGNEQVTPSETSGMYL
ncbi:peptidyl-prolyl cis-trans isomerase [Aeromicrobium flavum]|uniref:Bacterial proteasome activator n=1 Tax=Aeromicrobium flavum TaxID=416568 RepID=A0A512HTR8_9ACTN|nr:bacterial proteasome activator family protein [Aeromicrobium flavum]GEO88852.1 peptidyl-prolyl cis-trans isomerase [Aeromicrobium flavum]